MFQRKTFNSSSVGAPEFMIVGLGNPDRKYEFTRHNAGFLCVDMLAQKHGFTVKKLKFRSLLGNAVIGGHRCLILKPQTYMNLSGEAVREAAAFYKIPPERILVLFDDISLDVGKLRIRRKGTDGGHNGIKNIIYHLASDKFPRIKIGVGKKPHPDYDLADWVLSEFKKDEEAPLKSALENACAAVELLLDGETDKAMNLYNS
ncbi:MAG: aminoacyl-tRNA hydrolase [Lachnospiraceae bacterium]